MRPILKVLVILTLLGGVVSCGPEPKSTSKGKPGFGADIKFVSTKEIPDFGSITLLCIDGVKYIATDKGGLSPKFTAWENADPSVEECDEPGTANK
jgi:hypothetical protein